jgi:hypothetical protein
MCGQVSGLPYFDGPCDEAPGRWRAKKLKCCGKKLTKGGREKKLKLPLTFLHTAFFGFFDCQKKKS